MQSVEGSNLLTNDPTISSTFCVNCHDGDDGDEDVDNGDEDVVDDVGDDDIDDKEDFHHDWLNMYSFNAQ